MKELDVLLEQFTQTHHQALLEGSWPEFEALLRSEDDVLWDMLQNPAVGEASPFSQLLGQIRGSHA